MAVLCWSQIFAVTGFFLNYPILVEDNLIPLILCLASPDHYVTLMLVFNV